jgi:hypothetical protein
MEATSSRPRPRRASALSAFQAAGDECAKHLDAVNDVPLTPQKEENLATAVERDRQVARCLRTRGIDWPDPIPGLGGFSDEEIERSVPDHESPRVERALEQCEKEIGPPISSG